MFLAKAPEMINFSKYDARIDVWAFGVLIFEMANGMSYIKDKKNRKMYIRFLISITQFK